MTDRDKWIQSQIDAGSTKGRAQLGREYDALVAAGQIPGAVTTTTVPVTGEQAQTNAANVLAAINALINTQGGSTVANKVSPSSRPAIGITGTQYYDPATGQPLGYYGYTAIGQKQVYSAGRYGEQKVEVQPKFFDGDEDQIRRKSPEEIGSIQQQMVSAGLLSGKFNPGLADDKTVAAYKTLLGWANSFGVDSPYLAVQRLKEAGYQGKNVGTAKYVTNAADLKNVFDKTAQNVLGRTLDEQSLNRLVTAYQQEEKAPTQNTVIAGTKVKEPTAAVFGEKKITAQNKDEADAYKFAQYAQVLERLLGG